MKRRRSQSHRDGSRRCDGDEHRLGATTARGLPCRRWRFLDLERCCRSAASGASASASGSAAAAGGRGLAVATVPVRPAGSPPRQQPPRPPPPARRRQRRRTPHQLPPSHLPLPYLRRRLGHPSSTSSPPTAARAAEMPERTGEPTPRPSPPPSPPPSSPTPSWLRALDAPRSPAPAAHSSQSLPPPSPQLMPLRL